MKERNGDILLKAHDIINGEREKDYGNPDDSFGRIMSLWNDYLLGRGNGYNILITRKDVAIMMALLKIAREMNGHSEDSLVDCAGYIGLANDFAKKETRVLEGVLCKEK